MQRLLIRNISKLVSCDEGDTVYENVDLYAEDGVIRAIGPKLEKKAEEVLDASHMLCYPGLINTHHHLYQQFSRNLPQVQNMELFDWLKTLYEIWKNLDTDVVRLSSLTGMGELMKHGCTTCFDHHYVFPAGAGDLIGTQFEAASELGIRMHCSRGSMDLSVKDGGLPPDSVVQTVDEIMKDSARLIETYHDPVVRLHAAGRARALLAVLGLRGAAAAERDPRPAVPCPPAHAPVRDEGRGKLHARARGHAPAGVHADARLGRPRRVVRARHPF